MPTDKEVSSLASDGKVIIQTNLDNSAIPKGIKAIEGALGGLTKVVSATTAAITAAFGAAALAITKQSVDAYADYEQLLGGVETLFKDSAKKVTKYAENAFYTVGISANEYMETVTGFSASLISALGGDTEKAAEVADMALTDMADNANKLGTPLESIKTAYQGFAKQNYTMLDNLKLGYGGTKTEMERLLKDAEKLTGVKYDISNLADVYNAIHAIQENLGIAGTTAKEAEKTISGSASMMEAAWKNVLTAISGGGDLDKAINNLVFSVSKYFENIVPVVERSLAGIGQMIERISPMLVQTVATALIKAIPSLLNAVYQMVMGLADGIRQGIAALFSGEKLTVDAQLEDVDAGASNELAGNYAEAADSAEDLVESTKKTKRELAGFDELNILGGKEDAEDGTSGMLSVSKPVDVSVEAINMGGDVENNISPILRAVVDETMSLLEPIRNINFAPAIDAIQGLGDSFASFGASVLDALEWAWFNLLVPLAEWTIEDAAPASISAISGALDLLNAIIKSLKPLGEWLWKTFLVPMAKWTGGAIIEILQGITYGLTAVSDWINNNQALVEGLIIVVGSFAAAWQLVNGAITIWIGLSGIATAATTALGAAVSFLTSPIGIVVVAIGALIAVIALLVKNWDAVKEMACKVWDGIKSVWKSVATWFKSKVIDPISNFFKSMVNGVLGFINGLLSAIGDGVNFVVRALNKLSFEVPDWVPGIGGSRFGFNIPTVTVPQIPYLAKGAVIPPNKEFMAVLGDQRHGTNIEAPLSTIQEAVAAVMAEYEASNLAGHEATVEVLQQLLAAVLDIEVGDTTIGQAANRHNQKMAIIKGGL